MLFFQSLSLRVELRILQSLYFNLPFQTLKSLQVVLGRLIEFHKLKGTVLALPNLYIHFCSSQSPGTTYNTYRYLFWGKKYFSLRCWQNTHHLQDLLFQTSIQIHSHRIFESLHHSRSTFSYCFWRVLIIEIHLRSRDHPI